MKYLLDTAAFLWLALQPSKLPQRVRALCEKEETLLYLSSVSCWEIAQKHQRKRLALPEHPRILIPEIRMELNIYALPLEEKEALRMESLPLYHRDPADRLLICQALERNMPIITNDRFIQKYDVETVW